jgi:vancomycin resistance protein YoaR
MTDKPKSTKAPAKPRQTVVKKEAPKAKAAAAAKAAAKPRKTVAKKAEVTQPPVPAMPSREEIERLARQYWAQRGYQDGYAEQDWLRAERELLQKAS